MKIYLDNCAYNRPYDDLSQLTISLEAQAKLYIQDGIRKGKYSLVTSEMLLYEINESPVEMRRKVIMEFVEENSSLHVGPDNTKSVESAAAEIMETGIKYKDACHVASALIAECDYFISTDKRLLKFNSEKIRLVNPVQFISETEDTEHE